MENSVFKKELEQRTRRFFLQVFPAPPVTPEFPYSHTSTLQN